MSRFLGQNPTSGGFWQSSLCFSCYLKQLRPNATTIPTKSPRDFQISARRQIHSSSDQSNIDKRNHNGPISSTSPPHNLWRARLSQLEQCTQGRGISTFPSRKQETTIRSNIDQRISYIPTLSGRRIKDPLLIEENDGPKQDVRALLRTWQPPPDYIPPIPPAEEDFDQNGTVNSLTRPENSGGSSGTKVDQFDAELTESLQDFNRITDVSDGASAAATMLKQGDLVELRSPTNTALLGVFLAISENSYFQFYTMFGRLYSATYRTPNFQVHGYFSQEEIAPMMPFLPKVTNVDTNDDDVAIPRNVAAPVMKKLTDFRSASEAVCREYSNELEGAFALLAHPTEVRYMALEDMVSNITKKPHDSKNPHPDHVLFAISNAMMSDKFGFSFEVRTYASSRIIRIEPKENAMIMHRVHKWCRAHQEEAALIARGNRAVPLTVSKDSAIVKSFARKCQRLIAESRQLRRSSPENRVISCNKGAETQDVLSAQDVIHSLEFTDTDRDFIRALKLGALTGAIHHQPSYRSIPAMIVRAVDEGYADSLGYSELWNFLIEIGAVDPYDHAEGFDTEAWPANQKLERELSQIEAQVTAGRPVMEAANLQDSMVEFRRDWGDLPVLCIDGLDTHEVDDGISLEEVTDEPGTYWVRVHVSHISAFTSPGHIVGRRGEHKITSMYLETGAIGMLPSWVGQNFSVAPNSPVITYSTKVNSNGDILDHVVEPGTVRNVVYTTPELVNEAFGTRRTYERYDFEVTCGQALPMDDTTSRKTRPITSPTEEHIQQLRTLDSLLDKVKSKRGRSRMMSFNSMELMDLHVTNPYTSTTNHSSQHSKGSWDAARVAVYTNPTHAIFTLRDPIIKMSINQSFDDILSSADMDKSRSIADVIVEQSMLLAGICGARWAAARNIPIIFTGTRPAVDGLDSVTELARQELVQEGTWTREVIGKMIQLYAIRHLSSYPVPQRLMNMPEYAKLTSPLRRFTDLVSSWQIDAALREEHRTGLSLVGRPDVNAPYLPYQRAGMEKVIRFVNFRAQEIQWWARAHRKHWQIQAIARGFYLGEWKVPEKLSVKILKVKQARRSGTIRELECVCGVIWDGPPENKMDGPLEGQVWECEILVVNMYSRDVQVKALKRVE